MTKTITFKLDDLLASIQENIELEDLPETQTETQWLAKFLHDSLLAPFHAKQHGTFQETYAYAELRKAATGLKNVDGEASEYSFELDESQFVIIRKILKEFESWTMALPEVILAIGESFELSVDD